MFTVFLVITGILGIVGFIALFGDTGEITAGCIILWVLISLMLLVIWAWNENEKNLKKAASPENTKVEISQEIAKAYYQGQRDYAEGNIHIRDVRYDHCYHWESSPWKEMNVDSLPYNPECAQKKDDQ